VVKSGELLALPDLPSGDGLYNAKLRHFFYHSIREPKRGTSRAHSQNIFVGSPESERECLPLTNFDATHGHGDHMTNIRRNRSIERLLGAARAKTYAQVKLYPSPHRIGGGRNLDCDVWAVTPSTDITLLNTQTRETLSLRAEQVVSYRPGILILSESIGLPRAGVEPLHCN